MFKTQLPSNELKYLVVVTPTGNNGHFINSFKTLPEVASYCNLVGAKGDAVKITNQLNAQVKELVIGG